MSNQVEKIFANGFSFKRRENAPDFVVGSLGIKVEDAIEFLSKHQKKGWVNLNVLKSSKGSCYIELDTYVPTLPGPIPSGKEDNDDLPF